jgi:NifU-like protein involved in Fe-S cluster formation
MIYNDLTRCCFENARSAGTASGPGWFRGEAGSRSQGTWVQFDVQVSAEGVGVIRDVRFLAFGCPHVIAVAQWLAERSIGLPGHAQLPETVQELRQRFELPVEKLGRLLVVEDAWVAALRVAARATAVGD